MDTILAALAATPSGSRWTYRTLMINRQGDLSGNESTDAQTEQERIFKQLKEIESFEKKIEELLAEGYDPIHRRWCREKYCATSAK